MLKPTENAKRHIGEVVTIRWGTSRGRDSYGYTTCSLRNDRGERVAACNGGGYDMRGTVIGNWIAHTFPNELNKLRPQDMPKNSHWEPERARVCDGQCKDQAIEQWHKAEETDPDTIPEALPRLGDDTWECPVCKGKTRPSGDGKTVEDRPGFYGLRFVDPTYNPNTAILERADGTFTMPEDVGKQLGELAKAGKLVDLDMLRAWYKRTSPVPTKRHTRPSIDGGCGESSVLKILNAIGLGLRRVHETSKIDVYEITEYKKD